MSPRRATLGCALLCLAPLAAQTVATADTVTAELEAAVNRVEAMSINR